MVKMPYKFKRDCPVCGKPELLSLNDHLRQVHRLKSHERKQWLKAAVFSGSKKSLGITQGVSRLFHQVLHAEKETSRERKRTIAAVKETEKPPHYIVKRRIWWYYSQWQDRYKVMQSPIGKEIQFIRGLPEFKDLREIDPKFTNVLVFGDLMAQATDSPLISFPFCLLKADIEILVLYFCYKICFQRENLTRT